MISLDGLVLSADLWWSDEYRSSNVSQSARRCLDGSLVVFYSGQHLGMPITLESQSDAGWLTRAQVEALQRLADSPGGVYLLQLRGTSQSVMFRHHEAPAFEATPLLALAYPASTDYYRVTLKLMTV